MLILTILACYLLLGCAFGIAFFVRGYRVIATEAAEASVAVRLLWLPGAVALWPVLVWQWVSRRRRS